MFADINVDESEMVTKMCAVCTQDIAPDDYVAFYTNGAVRHSECRGRK